MTAASTLDKRPALKPAQISQLHQKREGGSDLGNPSKSDEDEEKNSTARMYYYFILFYIILHYFISYESLITVTVHDTNSS